MFRKVLYTFALIFLLIGTANAGPLNNFTGSSFVEQTTTFYNNISRNWSNLPIGKIILTHILTTVNAHPPTVLFQNEKEDIMLIIAKGSTRMILGTEHCTFFSVRISSKSGQNDTQFNSIICFNPVKQISSIRISDIDYNPATK